MKGDDVEVELAVELELVSWISDDEFAFVLRKMGIHLVLGKGKRKDGLALGIAR